VFCPWRMPAASSGVGDVRGKMCLAVECLVCLMNQSVRDVSCDRLAGVPQSALQLLLSVMTLCDCLVTTVEAALQPTQHRRPDTTRRQSTSSSARSALRQLCMSSCAIPRLYEMIRGVKKC
jgi:hypothetical protein